MDERDLEMVSAAFERLLATVAESDCAAEYVQTIYFAKVDVLAILRGEWDAPAVIEDAPVFLAEAVFA